MPCEITGYHSGAAEDSSLLARNDVSFGELLPAFLRIVVPSCSGSSLI